MNARRTWLGIYSPDDRIKSETPHVSIPSAAARARPSAVNRVLPIPASPTTSTNRARSPSADAAGTTPPPGRQRPPCRPYAHTTSPRLVRQQGVSCQLCK